MKQRSPPTRDRTRALLVDHMRLFRNRPEHRWQYRVHEPILPALQRTRARIVFTDIVIEHTGYEDPAVRHQKLLRNLRLLELDIAENPHDPFILFNLGWAYNEMGRYAEALPILRKSLEVSHPTASTVPLLFTFLIQCHRRLGQWGAAFSACRAARARFPDNADLLFREAELHKDRGDLRGAEAALERLLGGASRGAAVGFAPYPQPLSPEIA